MFGNTSHYRTLGEQILEEDGWQEYTLTSVLEAYPDIDLPEVPSFWRALDTRVFVKPHPQGPTGIGAKIAYKTFVNGKWSWLLFVRVSDFEQIYLYATNTNDRERIDKVAQQFRRPAAQEFALLDLEMECEPA